jgi:hypothetical protein
MDQYTAGHSLLVTEIQAHPIYKHMVADVPRIETAPSYPPFDPLRRVRVIADNMARPMPRMPRKTSRWRRTSSRPDRKRARELNAIKRLQRVTNSPERKRILAAWAAHDMRRLPVALGKIAHPAVWRLAFELLVHAHTADVRLLLEAAQLVDSGGCDDATAARYIKQVQKI